MGDISGRNSTLAEVAVDFLASLPSQDKEKTQTEVYRFIRWLGLHRKVAELSPLDVASYAEQITPSAIQPVKSFLGYIRRKGLTEVNLAPHLRVKKASSKATLPQQGPQVQTTLTAQGYAKLEEQLMALKSQRSHIAEELHKAAADKDFRENAPLDAIREQKAHLEGRIQELELTLQSAKVIEEKQVSSKIKMGDMVVLHDLSSNKELRYVLVDPKETNPSQGRISVASPIGKVLLDKKKGQTIEVRAPAGTFSYRIEDIQQKTS